MLKCILCVGIPGSGKSTWAKAEVAKDPENWVRINNDDLRAMMNGSVWSAEYEKMIGDVRNYLIRDAFKKYKNVIIDNLNLNRRHFDDVCKIAKQSSRDIQVFEKTFYIPIEEAIVRDSTREGKSKVGEQIVRKWYKESGKEQFKYYKSRIQIFTTNNHISDSNIFHQNEELERAYLVDLDGTVANISHRTSPYAANECLNDAPINSVIDTIIALYKSGYKIVFMSGRTDEFYDLSKQWIDKYITINNFPIEYKLFMRKTNDTRSDDIIKKELFDNNIRNKYYVVGVFDDRPRVIRMWREIGLIVFQLNDLEF